MTVDCPACAAALPEGARFCVMCGTRLALCPSCGTPAAPEQRSCGSCGSQLAAVVSPVRERRQVSVLFCDLVGFTRFSERRDHEEVRPVLEEYFAVARSAVTTHRGRIEKFIGDAVMAVWGTSIAREDDAERAVRTALAITKAVAQLADRLAIPELQVRVGVLAGEATVDAGMVIGDAVNTASRIQSLAAPGTVLVDETTRRMCDEAFGFRDAGAHPVKGKAEPVQTWQVIGAGRGGRSEDVVDGALVEPPFIGREAIVATVRGALQRLVSGALPAAIVTAIGAAGLGKSRLAHELEQMVAALPRPVVCHRGRAVSYGEGGGFHALAEIVRAAAGATAEDTTDDLAFAVEALLVRVVGDLSERDRIRLAAHRLLDLDDGTATLERGELFSAWRSLLVRLADEQPVVLVFDDLQFAGQEQLDFIAHLRAWAGAAAILILAESRPDARVEALAALGDRVELAPLSDPQIEQLVAGTVREAPPALVAAIRADGAGIPLYAIETLRALADQGILVVRDGRYVVHGELLEVPPTIRALVASRLDTLSGEERRALVVCAVLGERFAASSMSAVAALGPAPVVDILRRLMTRALLL
jgi:class 3 adenylate cyclase